MRTYRQHSRGLARGLGLLCALALLRPGRRRSTPSNAAIWSSSAPAGLYQSFDSLTELKSAFGGVGRIGLWLPYHFSVEPEGAFAGAKTETEVGVSTRTLAARSSTTFRWETSWAHLRAGRGSTKFGDPCPPGVARHIICGSSRALMAGAGVRVGITPELLIRGDALGESKPERQRPSRGTSPTSA